MIGQGKCRPRKFRTAETAQCRVLTALSFDHLVFYELGLTLVPPRNSPYTILACIIKDMEVRSGGIRPDIAPSRGQSGSSVVGVFGFLRNPKHGAANPANGKPRRAGLGAVTWAGPFISPINGFERGATIWGGAPFVSVIPNPDNAGSCQILDDSKSYQGPYDEGYPGIVAEVTGGTLRYPENRH